MIAARIGGATHELGRSQGYSPLHIQARTIETEGGDKVHVLVSAWEPTPVELEALNSGAKVHLYIVGVSHPPVMVTVGEMPEPAPTAL